MSKSVRQQLGEAKEFGHAPTSYIRPSFKPGCYFCARCASGVYFGSGPGLLCSACGSEHLNIEAAHKGQ